MSLDFSPDGVARQDVDLGNELKVGYMARDLRSERTGLHARILVLRGEGMILASDTFNITRNEDRTRLANSAHKMVGPTIATVYSATAMKHALDLFCWEVERAWERRFKIEIVNGARPLGPIPFVLQPYVLREGGTLLFAPPGQGKTYIALLMAQSIHHGVQLFWPVTQAEVLFVNLERSGLSVERRMAGVNRALGLPLEASLPILNARGKSLKDVGGTIRQAVKEGKANVVFLDSVSRAGFGTLVDDANANGIIDLLNALCPTWLAIGHTSRAEETHIYGSIHFDAGEDVGVKLTSEKKDTTLGISLEIVKANDIDWGKPQVFRLTFDPTTGLQTVERAGMDEFPTIEGKQPLKQRIWDALSSAMGVGEIAESLGEEIPSVRTMLNRHKDMFTNIQGGPQSGKWSRKIQVVLS